MKLKEKLEDYTESEFLEFARKVCNADYATEDEASVAVQDFIRLSEHPDGTDILFYPSPGQDDSPEEIVKQIKEWRARNGKPGFKK
ncbi:bacteriocin immunity protein [Photorhabdus hindustanensis]|uniref:Bacteriocin immunity protein n=1 Tax=Photorhabdus hindustanensis TaxID=2918802 RepID=A0A2S8Q695_9GAMM|nr:bacteriocin immunity protein [Photorhabdus hindustanensis]PQQ28047.1 bacteriocin immunity protein [Photorhabdus hindustanensis]